MAKTKRYLFEKDFEAEAAAAKAEAATPPPPAFSEADIENARTIGFAEGRTAGLAEAQASIERAAAQTLAAIASKLVEFLQAYAAKTAEARQSALDLGVAIARKAVPAIAEAHAATCVETLIRDSLPNFMAEPRIVVRVAERMLAALKPRLESQIGAIGYAGKVIVLGETSLSPPDCRIEWADGGIEIDTATAWRRIDETLARFITSLPTAGGDASNADERTDQ